MTPAEMAALHRLCFVTPEPWSEAGLAATLASPHSFLLTESEGFLIGRAVAGEAELLTLAVAPAARRGGKGARLVAGFLAEAQARGAERAFLEVAADNSGAIALYTQAGFAPAGLRRRYYATPDGGAVDALVMALDLPGGALPKP